MKDYDYRAKTHFIRKIRPGLKQIRTLVLLNSELTRFGFESQITNGLGYNPVRKTMQESKVHSQEGLQTHLANMDYLFTDREAFHHELRISEYGRAMIELEDLTKKYIEVMGDLANLLLVESTNHELHHGNYMPGQRAIRIAKRCGLDVSEYEETKNPESRDLALKPTSESEEQPAQAQRSKPWYRRISN